MGFSPGRRFVLKALIAGVDDDLSSRFDKRREGVEVCSNGCEALSSDCLDGDCCCCRLAVFDRSDVQRVVAPALFLRSHGVDDDQNCEKNGRGPAPIQNVKERY